MKKVVIISTSLRPGSNSAVLAESFAKGVRDAGNRADIISLSGKDIRFCKGCLACQTTQRCVIRDDVEDIIQTMKGADAIAFATPIYYYEMAGQMKTLLDRSNPLFPGDYSFRDIYLLATAAADDDQACQRAVTGLEGWIACYPKTRLAGVVFGGGVTGPREMEGHPAVEEAYNMGKDA